MSSVAHQTPQPGEPTRSTGGAREHDPAPVRGQAAGWAPTAILTPGTVAALQRHGGNRAAATAIQRRVITSERDYLRDLLASGDPIVHSLQVLSGNARTRIRAMGHGDRVDTIRAVRSHIDAFEVAIGGTLGFGHVEVCRFVSALEAAQDNTRLGNRLVTLFQASTDPLVGLAIVSDLPPDRVRAVLEGHARGRQAIDTLLTRVPIMTVPVHLGSAHSRLTTMRDEMAAPDTEGVTASDATREAAVEQLLTPQSVRDARAAAAAAGLPPPTFIEAGYYDDLMQAVHTVVQSYHANAARMDAQRAMDTSAGGHVEGIAAQAKSKVDALFGRYGSAAAPALTFASGNLRDQTTTSGDPFDLTRWVIEDSGEAAVTAVKEAHHAFADPGANRIGRDVMAHYSNTAARAAGPAPADLDRRLGVSAADREARLRLIDRMWPGMAGGGRVSIRAREGATPHETRAQYWGLFKTLIHEYIHTTEHPTYRAWYRRLTDQHQQIVFQEGFTDLFTKKTWRSIFPDHIASSASFRRSVQGSDVLDLPAVGRDPAHYPEMAEAEQLETLIGLPNMKAAYFRGKTAVLGGGRLPR